MNTIKEFKQNEIVINKSRFITSIFPVKNIAEVEKYLQDTRKKYYDATHNCYAYIIGNNQEIQKCSDDGEPSQTAGAPMMDVLKKNNMTNVLVIVTRYFGGILLGAGGLVRAYSQAVSSTLDIIEIYQIQELQKILISISYPEYSLLEESINQFDVINSRFSQSVDISLGIPLNSLEYFETEFRNVTRGKGILIKDNIYHGIIKK
jgi:uncharacterized YigZ family protein